MVTDERHPSLRIQARNHWRTLPTRAQAPYLHEALAEVHASGMTGEDATLQALRLARILAWRADRRRADTSGYPFNPETGAPW